MGCIKSVANRCIFGIIPKLCMNQQSVFIVFVRFAQRFLNAFFDCIKRTFFNSADLSLGYSDFGRDLHLGFALEKPQTQNTLFPVGQAFDSVLDRKLLEP